MPSRSSPPTVTIPTGKILTRIHREGVDPLWFGNRDKTWRWDAPDESYGVLYVGAGQIGPFAETLLRDPAQRDVFWSDIAKRRFATFEATRPLVVARLHGKGLGWFGIQASDITEHFDPLTHPTGYDKPQEISCRVHAEPTLDGIQYRSRFDNDELCLAIFERAQAALARKDRDQPIGRRWAHRTLADRGYNLLDL